MKAGLSRGLDIHQGRPRLLFRVDPEPRESPHGYLCRAADAHGYRGPSWLTELAGFRPGALARPDHIASLAYTLRLEEPEWREICYAHVKVEGLSERRSFCGQTIDAFQLNECHPRICPRCLQDRSVWWSIWDLALVTACPLHRCYLIDTCSTCENKLTWQQPAVHECRCGMDLRQLNSKAAPENLLVVNAAIYRAADFHKEACSRLLQFNSFPSALSDLPLDWLMRLIRFLGSIQKDGHLLPRQNRIGTTNLNVATEIGIGAAAMLTDWPLSFCSMLRLALSRATEPLTNLRLRKLFGNFYRHLFLVLPRKEFAFLHEAFEKFVREDWKGVVRPTLWSSATYSSSYWVTASNAGEMTHLMRRTIAALVRGGHLTGVFIGRGRGASECWVNRESLKQWIAKRDQQFARYFSRQQAMRVLGFDRDTLLTVAQAGLIHYVDALPYNFPAGVYFDREDVARIRGAFDKHTVSALGYSQPGDIIALYHARKHFLTSKDGLPAFIHAVLEGSVAPIGHAPQFPGIDGYLFRTQEVRKFRCVSKNRELFDGMITYREAASMLNTRLPVVRGLVAHGMIFRCRPGKRRSKLIVAEEVRRFAQKYVPAGAIAERFNTNRRWVYICLKAAAIPVLAVPVLGRGKMLFVPREVADHLQIPPPKSKQESAVKLGSWDRMFVKS